MKRTTIVVSSMMVLWSINAQPPNTPEVIDDVSQAWVRLYDDKSSKDRVLTVKSQKDISDFNKVRSDNGTKGFGDKTSSVQFQIPKGWKAVLFDDNKFKDSALELKGTGKVEEISDLGSFSDKASSIRWERD